MVIDIYLIPINSLINFEKKTYYLHESKQLLQQTETFFLKMNYKYQLYNKQKFANNLPFSISHT